MDEARGSLREVAIKREARSPPKAAKPVSSRHSQSRAGIWASVRAKLLGASEEGGRLWMGRGNFEMLGTRSGDSCPVKNQKQRNLTPKGSWWSIALYRESTAERVGKTVKTGRESRQGSLFPGAPSALLSGSASQERLEETQAGSGRGHLQEPLRADNEVIPDERSPERSKRLGS